MSIYGAMFSGVSGSRRRAVADDGDVGRRDEPCNSPADRSSGRVWSERTRRISRTRRGLRHQGLNEPWCPC